MGKIVKFFSRRRSWSLPYVLFLAVFVVAPLVLIMIYAFQAEDGGFSVANFEKFVHQREAMNTFIYSIGVALITTLVCILLGYPAAYILSKMRSSTARVVVMLFILPMWINVLVRTLATVALFDFLKLPSDEGALIFGMVYNFLPFMIYPIYNTLQKMDTSLMVGTQTKNLQLLMTSQQRLQRTSPFMLSGQKLKKNLLKTNLKTGHLKNLT